MKPASKKIYSVLRRALNSGLAGKDFVHLACSFEYAGASESELDLVVALERINLDSLGTVRNAFSEGQIESKEWLIDVLCQNLSIKGKSISVLGGWIGLLPHFLMRSLKAEEFPDRIYSIDIDPSMEQIVDAVNKRYLKADWLVKGVTADMMAIDYDGQKVEAKRSDGSQCELFINSEIIINTSTEHLERPSAWWNLVPKGKSIVLQSNDLQSEPDHRSCVKSIEEMKGKFPMSEIIFAGELKLSSYTRYMLIGKK